MDLVNYARWLSVHLCDILQLEDTNPDIFSHFNDGEFVISKTKRAFSYIGIDHAHEQNNNCVKGGILINFHISQKKIIYIVCYFNSANQDGIHFIYSHNYFSSILILESPDLITLDTKNIADTKAIETLNNVERIGIEQYNKFVEERLKTEKKSIFDTISTNIFSIFRPPVLRKMKLQHSRKAVSCFRNCILHVRFEMEIYMNSSDMKIAPHPCSFKKW